MTRRLRFFLVAGEASGDLLGGRLMASLRRLCGGCVVFDGIGGPQMAEQGLVSRFPMSELSLMGLVEILPHLPGLLRRLQETRVALRAMRPDALITVDAPAFSLRLARSVGPGVTRRIHYVAPQVWAWRPGRAAKIAHSVDRLLTLLPFEPPYFTRYGLACDYVGHPIVESGILQGNGQRFRQALAIEPHRPVLALLPGSRWGEIKRMAAIFGQTVRLLQEGKPNLLTVALLAPGVESGVKEALADLPQLRFVERESEKHDAFAAADAALAASGTVTLELALAGIPAAVAYRTAPVTAFLAKRLLQVSSVVLPNIVLGKPVYPEFLQELCTPHRLAEAVEPLLDRRSYAWQAQKTALQGFLALMRADREADRESPSDRAARVILADLAQASGLEQAKNKNAKNDSRQP